MKKQIKRSKSTKLNPDEWYAPRRIAFMKVDGFPWASAYTFSRKLNEKRWQEEFRPLIEQHTVKKTYLVRGERIIRFINRLQKGQVKL